MAPARRRISYVIPPSCEPVNRLQLPPSAVSRLGTIGPLLSRLDVSGEQTDAEVKPLLYPRHRLGVAALALDMSTQLTSRPAPEGILYSGGRDGLLISWDLGFSMHRRKERIGNKSDNRSTVDRWENITGWGDDVIEEEGEDGEEKPIVDGDFLGDVLGSDNRGRDNSEVEHAIPYERRWEINTDAPPPSKPSQFRQCVQAHTEWVNDVLLCNYNQTVISASSDGMVKAWQPHSPNAPEPATIGVHNDYVRCLTHCDEQSWVASGSFDRTIKLWDLSRTVQSQKSEPLVTLNPPDMSAPKASIYAIATDPLGRSIASGSPERVIRLWDPRSGRRTGKLVGHSDNIRAILISEDSKYLLTGSADASIKLWSLASQKCLHTFIHHTESVWSLFSSHPSFETFYSGDKSGLVCKVDVEGCSDVSEGECIVLCRDAIDRSISSPEGINRIVAADDMFLWTASGSSCIKRWRVPQRRANRASSYLQRGTDVFGISDSPPSRKRSVERPHFARNSISFTAGENRGLRDSLAPSLAGSDIWLPQRDREEETTLHGLPYQCLVRLTSANDSFTPYPSRSRVHDPDVATLYSAASVKSIPRIQEPRPTLHPLVPHRSHTDSPKRGDSLTPARFEEPTLPINNARAEYEERELAADAEPLYDLPDGIIKGDPGLVRSIILNDRIHALSVDTSGEVAVWDIVRCICLGRYTHDDVSTVSQSESAKGVNDDDDRKLSPREALEVVRERIEGEAVVLPWSSVDTKTGVLTVHITEKCFEAEIYADEAKLDPEKTFNDEARLNIGRWVLRNLFLGFVREEHRTRRKQDSGLNGNHSQLSLYRAANQTHFELKSNGLHKRSSSDSSKSSAQRNLAGSAVISSPEMSPAMLPTMLSSAKFSPLLHPVRTLLPVSKDNNSLLSPIPQSPVHADNSQPPKHSHSNTSDTGQPVASSTGKETDYFTMRPRKPSISSAGGPPSTADDVTTGTAAAAGGSSKRPSSQETGPVQTPGTPGGGLMGRLKSFGKSAGRKAGDAGVTSPGAAGGYIPLDSPVVGEDLTPGPLVAKTPLQLLLSGPISPPSSSEAPTLLLPPHTLIMISEEDSPGWTTIYRGSVSTTHLDLRALEEAMPMWLLEYLLRNKYPIVHTTKISFIMLPWPSRYPDVQLPELLNTAQSRLTASRFLRVRKLTNHVQDKLEKLAAASNTGSFRSSPHDATSRAPRPNPEDLYEILCNDVLLPLDMTLAAVRQFVWRQSAELVLYYRRRASENGTVPRIGQAT